MPSVQYSVLDRRPCSLSVQPPPHTGALDQLPAVVLLPAAVGGKIAEVWSSVIGAVELKNSLQDTSHAGIRQQV